MYSREFATSAGEEQDWRDSEGADLSEMEVVETPARRSSISAVATAVLSFGVLALLAVPIYWSQFRHQGVLPSLASVQEVQELQAYPGAAGGDSLKPVENLHDGNVCEDDEELFENLCYKKCALLTANQFCIRTSPFSCCASHPCGFSNQKVMMRTPCNGYDISGDTIGGGCPHQPGACLEDEELNLGICYKKCSLLTNGQYPHRVAAATCCKSQGLFCLNIFLDKTEADFAVGGGKGDGDASTPGNPHYPLTALTESS